MNIKTLKLLGIFLLIFTLVGCHKARNVDAPATVRIGFQKDGALVFLKEKKYLEAELAKKNIKVVWTEFPSGPPLLEALNTGNLDFGPTGDTPPIFAQSAGVELTYVAYEKSSPDTVAIVVAKNSKINQLTDLKGKKIGVTKGSNANCTVIEALQKAGLKLTDVNIVYLSPADGRVAFEQGHLDAWAIWDPYLAAAELNVGAKRLISDKDLKKSNYSFYIASKNFVNNHANVLKIVLQQIAQVDDHLSKDVSELSKLITHLTGLPENIATTSVKRANYGLSPMNKEVVAEQQHVADTFYRLGLMPNKINVADNVWYAPS